MPWIVTRLKMQGIKGILDRSGDFKLASKRKPKSIAIFAPNGCGKSGYADAMEYLFSSDGGIDHLGKGGADSERGGKHAIPHVLAEEKGITPEVSISLFNTETEERIDISRPVTTGRSDDRPPELEKILQNAPAHRVLRQHDLRRFVVDMTPGEKYSELSRWMGLTRLETILRHLMMTSNELDDIDLDREIAERQQDILNNTDQEVTSTNEDEIFSWCAVKAEEFLDREIKIHAMEEFSSIIEEIEQVRLKNILESSASDAYHARSSLEQNIPELIISEGHLNICIHALNDVVISSKKDSELKRNAKSSMFKQTWEAAEKLLRKESLSICPVCSTEWEKTTIGSQDQVIIQIETNLADLAELSIAENDLNQKFTLFKSAFRNLSSVWSMIKNDINVLGMNEFEAIFDDISSDIEYIASIDKSTSIDEEYTSNLCGRIQNLISNEIFPEVKRKEITGVPKIAQDIELLETKFNNLFTAIRRLTELEREYQEYQKIKDGFNSIANTIQEYSSDLVNEIVDAFRTDVISIYRKIHPGGTIPNIHIVPEVDTRTLSLRTDFHEEGRTVPPAGYLSESYINTLGLALFISSVGLFNNSFPFLILDDIVSSYDADHRARIVDVIAERLDEYQVFLTTHDFRFYTMLRDRLADKGWKFERVSSWDINHGPLRESDALRQDEIDQLIQQGDPARAGNAVRQYMEDWLDKMCVNYWVFTQHKRGDQVYNRTLFDFWGPFLQRIESIKGDFFEHHIEPQPCFERLKCHSLLNFYSHSRSNPYEWPSIGDVDYVWTEFQAFQTLFRCSSCNKVLQFDRGENRFYCTCGGQIYAFIEENKLP